MKDRQCKHCCSSALVYEVVPSLLYRIPKLHATNDQTKALAHKAAIVDIPYWYNFKSLTKGNFALFVYQQTHLWFKRPFWHRLNQFLTRSCSSIVHSGLDICYGTVTVTGHPPCPSLYRVASPFILMSSILIPMSLHSSHFRDRVIKFNVTFKVIS